MITQICGAACKINALTNKYVDVRFAQEVDVTDETIKTLLSMFGGQPYYAIRIFSNNTNFIDYLARTFGFLNGVLWSSRKKPPMDTVFTQIVDGSQLQIDYSPAGDEIYHDGSYFGNEYVIPIGCQNGHNVFIKIEGAPIRVLNPIWDGTNNYEDEVDCQFPPEIEKYFRDNQIVLINEHQVHTLSSKYAMQYTPYNNGLAFSGDNNLQLTQDRLVVYNNQINMPLSMQLKTFDRFVLSADIFKTCKAIVFEHKRTNYLCVPEMNLLAALAFPLKENWFTVESPIGKTQNGEAIKILHWVAEIEGEIAI